MTTSFIQTKLRSLYESLFIPNQIKYNNDILYKCHLKFSNIDDHYDLTSNIDDESYKQINNIISFKEYNERDCEMLKKFTELYRRELLEQRGANHIAFFDMEDSNINGFPKQVNHCELIIRKKLFNTELL